MSKRKFLSIKKKVTAKGKCFENSAKCVYYIFSKTVWIKMQLKNMTAKKILQSKGPNTNNTTVLVLPIPTMTLNSPLLILWKFDNEEETISIDLLSLTLFWKNHCTVNIAVYDSNAGALKLIKGILLPT